MEPTEASIGPTRRFLARAFGVLYAPAALAWCGGWAYIYLGFMWQAVSKDRLAGVTGAAFIALCWVVPGFIQLRLGLRAIRGDLRAVYWGLVMLIVPGIPLLLLSALSRMSGNIPNVLAYWFRGGLLTQLVLLVSGAAICFIWPTVPAGTQEEAPEPVPAIED